MLTSQQIVNLACLTAKCPGYLSLAGQKLNVILQELSQDYDFAVNRAVATFVFNGPTGTQQGPYTLPTNWLRAGRNDVWYNILGVMYVMIPLSLPEYDALVQQAGLSGYPEYFAVDNAPLATQGAPLMYVWPPPAGSYPVTARYQIQTTDITTPETSSTIPWFPNQMYLERRLAGELMLITNDDRAPMFLGETSGNGFEGARAILTRYMKQEGDAQVTKTVELDRRRFGLGFDRVKNTKLIGW